MELKIDLADHVYWSCKYAQIFWCRNIELFLNIAERVDTCERAKIALERHASAFY